MKQEIDMIDLSIDKCCEMLQPISPHRTHINFQTCTLAPILVPILISLPSTLLPSSVGSYRNAVGGAVCEISQILSIFKHYMHDEDIQTANELLKIKCINLMLNEIS